MTKIDIAVVGGGVIGLAIGRELAASGASVIVIDEGSASASEAAAGMLAPSFETTTTPTGVEKALFDLGRESLAFWSGFADDLQLETGIDLDFAQAGVLGVALDRDDHRLMAGRVAALCEAGVDSKLLDTEDVLALEPLLTPHVEGGLLLPDEGQVDPRAVRAALRASFEKEAGREVLRKHVFAVEQDQYGVTVRLQGGETLSAARAVIATGAARTLIGDLPIVPVKGEALAIESNGARPSRVIRWQDAYVCPKSNGRTVIGATELPGSDELTPRDSAIASLTDKAARLVPLIGDAVELERWAGIRPGTADGAPLLGAAMDNEDRIVFAIGHYRNGILLTPATVMFMKAYLGGEGINAIPPEFRAGRFYR